MNDYAPPQNYNWGGKRCFWCDRKVTYAKEDVWRVGRRVTAPDTATREHLWPRRLGGENSKLNVVVACRQCNQARGNLIIWSPPHPTLEAAAFLRHARRYLQESSPMH